MTRWTEAQLQAHKAMYGRDAVAKPAQAAIAARRERVHSFVIPLAPTVNRLHHVAADGTRVLTDEQRAFRNDVCGAVAIAMRGAEPLEGRLALDVRVHLGNRRRTDISNRVKAIEDALTHARAYLDDSQIDALTVCRVVDPDTPEHCVVTVSEIAAKEPA